MPSDSMYPAAGDTSAETETPETESADKEEKVEGQTSLIPKNLFPYEPEVGAEYVFEVVRVYDDEVEIKYAPEKPEKPESAETPPSPEMTAAEGKLESMAE